MNQKEKENTTLAEVVENRQSLYWFSVFYKCKIGIFFDYFSAWTSLKRKVMSKTPTNFKVL